MTAIPLTERVPPDYHRLFMFFGEGDFKSIICVDGSQEMYVGSHGNASPRSQSDCLDWQAVTVMRIRSELQELENLGKWFTE